MIGETIVRLRQATTKDAYGNTVPTGEPDRAEIYGAGFDPGGSIALREGGRDGTTATPTLYLPPGADITSRDRVEVRGLTYEVNGEIADWRNPLTGAAPGLVVPLRRVEG